MGTQIKNLPRLLKDIAKLRILVVGKIGTATVTPAELSAYVAHES